MIDGDGDEWRIARLTIKKLIDGKCAKSVPAATIRNLIEGARAEWRVARGDDQEVDRRQVRGNRCSGATIRNLIEGARAEWRVARGDDQDVDRRHVREIGARGHDQEPH